MPYDGSSRPFAIGLKPLDPAEWIELDDGLEAFLAEKDRLYAERAEDVFVAEPETVASQREVLEMLAGHLVATYPDLYARIQGGMAIPSLGRTVALDDPLPLKAASRLVQEDLILMRNGAEGWRLAAGSLCFPSSWSLREKFGRPLDEIHGPVPAFGRGTRMSELINRIFDNLAVKKPVLRWNWSIQAGDALHKPFSHDQRLDRAARPTSKFAGDAVASAFIRVERQTLRRLPASGDILFTIRIHLDPVAALARHPDRAALASGLADQLDALDRAQLDYKGLAADRDGLAAYLRWLALEPDPERCEAVFGEDQG